MKLIRKETQRKTEPEAQPPSRVVALSAAETINDEGAGEWSPSAEATLSNRRPTGESLFAPNDLVATAGGAVEIIQLSGQDIGQLFEDPDRGYLWLSATSQDESIATARATKREIFIDPLTPGDASIHYAFDRPLRQEEYHRFRRDGTNAHASQAHFEY